MTLRLISLLENTGSCQGGSGSIISNLGYVVSRIATPASAVYSGAKGTVKAIASMLTKELGPRLIRVNAIKSGMVETEGSVSAGFIGSDFEKATIAQATLGRTGQPGDFAKVSGLLASNGSGWLTGEQLIASDGIRLLRTV